MCAHNMPGVIHELIELMRTEARELEKLVVHVEQFAGKLPEEPQFAAIAAQLTALKARVKQVERLEMHEAPT